MPISDLVLIVMGLLTVAMLAASIARNLPIPYTVFLVLVGMILGALADSFSAFGALAEFNLTPDLVFFIFLPALIFESALNLDARQLLKDIAPIFMLAAPALVICTALIGIGLWLYMDLPLTLTLVFGALIAATDPVAVVALFKELGAPARLTTLVEGESLFNDATAIVLFHILLSIAIVGDFSTSDLGHAFVEFVRVFFGGILVGALVGIGISELMRRIRGSEIAILIMSLVMAYASFVIAEHLLHVSGVMAAVAAAVAMGLFAISRIPPGALRSIHETWEVIALVCNSLLFLMIGLSVDLAQLVERLDGIVVAALLVLVARAATIYTFVPATVRFFSLPHVNLGERHIMWWGGLKGGLAVAIVLSIPDTLPGKPLLVDLTLGVVLFTLLINAPSIRPLMARLGLDRMSAEELAELRRGLLEAEGHARSVVARLGEAELLSPANRHRVDDDLRAVFEGYAPDVDASRQLRHTAMEALQLEVEELESLYEIGMIEEYTYLDLRAALRRERESTAFNDPHGGTINIERTDDNPFVRLEQLLVKWLRERNAFASLLARIQRARLNQVVQRDFATVLCGEAVIRALPARAGLAPDDVDHVVALYRERVAHTRTRLEVLKRDFPDYFTEMENRLAYAAAVTSARHHVEISFQHGDIGAKAFGRIDRRLEDVLAAFARDTATPSIASAADLIATVPLFSALPQTVLDKLAQRAQVITFLPGDVVIGQSEKGNALYILMQGTVRVSRNDAHGDVTVAKLGRGNFFGEGALLSDEIRSATVTATTSLTLLRLTRKDVLELAAEHAEIAQRLENAHRART